MKKRITYALLFAATVFVLCTAQRCNDPFYHVKESAPASVSQAL